MNRAGLAINDYIQNEILNPLERNNSYSDYNDPNNHLCVTGYYMKYPGTERKNFYYLIIPRLIL